ncbi:MAG: LTA synthase family protein [Rudaea sp.]|uniref:LTA synthase family protein n=1 Tax=unclassified Rudaea TaxID=2627037 RepID=UPI0010F84F1D|nr:MULTISPECIES: LTA synthase family protein [unclassified Rudaea]MBN8888168.1 LTA synthase family protein [Rudaea sp.]
MPKTSPLRFTTAKDSRRHGLIGAALMIALLLVLFALRGFVLVGITTGLADCPWCMGATAIQQDASILALLLALTGLSLLSARYLLQLPWVLLSALLLLAYAVDAILLKTLVQHLYLLDIVKFGKELDAIGRFGNVLIASNTGKWMAIGMVAGLLILIVAILPRPRRPQLALACFVAAAAFFLVGLWQPMTMKYINFPLLQNFIVANLEDSVDRRYSAAYTEALRKEYKPLAPVCEAGRALRPNIIVIAVESLSTYHSKLFGQVNDYTPHLDAIARENAYFPDFIANGFTTDGGLIALITGKPPIPILGRYESAEAFSGFESPKGALPEIVHAHGYTAHFFTTGDLGFLNKSKWLKELGFDSWEGAEQPFYNGWKRRHFKAAEDKALYQRFLQWLDARQNDSTPWLAFMLTVSTHPPFVNPENESFDEAGAFTYADKQIGMLYDELAKRDFFRNGVLMISGDHRSMTPLSAAEFRHFGDSALARTPFVVATQLPIARGAVAGKFQQVDVTPSIDELIGDRACRSAGQGTFLSMPPQPAHFVAHARSDRRSEVDVYFGNQQASIVLAGDQSRWVGPKPDDWKQIMDGITLERIDRGTAKENYIDLLIDSFAPKPAESKAPPAPSAAH